jgi:hypothetical protein
MSLVLDDLLRDPDRLLQHRQRMREVVSQQNASLASLQAEHNAVLAERDAARTESLAENSNLLKNGPFYQKSDRP